MRIILTCFMLWLGLPAVALAQRVEVPIKPVTLSDGVRRYAVTLSINGVPIEAGLDTGSTGLRVLAASLPGGASLHGSATTMGYGSGIEFAGPAVSVSLTIGTLARDKVKVQRIDKIGCHATQRDCADARVEPAHYRIQGDGLPDEGFAAIMGIGLHDDPVANPLTSLGARRWIVDLPHGPDARPGG